MVKKKTSPKRRREDFAIEVTVAELGARGDGIAYLATGDQAYIPTAAPDDRLRIRLGATRGTGRTATIETILAPGPDRILPVCRHFGQCGGCALQHLSGDAVATFKRGVVSQALERRGLAGVPLTDTVTIPPGSRRRAEFALRQAGRTVLGLHASYERRIVDLVECPVVRPVIAALLGPLRDLMRQTRFPAKDGDIRITETDTGIDLLFLTKDEPDVMARSALAALAEMHDIARVAWSDGRVAEPVAQRRQPSLRVGDTKIDLPISYFLQPSREGEAAIGDLVVAAVSGARRIADLYAGCGSLSFRVAGPAAVTACEIDDGMITALRKAAVGLSLTAERRDLARSPLTAAELAPFDAVIFDPPHAGARAQAEYLAASPVPTVVAVSCNPATLGRDLRLLVDGGYRIEAVTPIDQFTWSAEVEAVAVLRRA